jgi:GTP-binding protein
VQVEFIGSFPGLGGRPERVLPEFAFLGRSNCGKSSLINYVLQRKGLARTSGQPGKTRLLNYYLVQERFYLVDLPGYGYAKVSKDQRERWWRLFRSYVTSQDRPMAVLHLMDSRHEPSAQDREVAGWVSESGHPFAVVATKVDKLAKNQQIKHFRRIIAGLDLAGNIPFLPTSAAEKQGRAELLGWVDEVLTAGDHGV